MSLIFLCMAGVIFLILNVFKKAPLSAFNPSPSNMQMMMKGANKKAAEAKIRVAVGAAEQYAAERDGGYDGMNAEALNGIAPSPAIKFVDGAPQAGREFKGGCIVFLPCAVGAPPFGLWAVLPLRGSASSLA